MYWDDGLEWLFVERFDFCESMKDFLFPEKFPRLMDNYTDNEDARINELREDSDNVNELNGVELDDRT